MLVKYRITIGSSSFSADQADWLVSCASYGSLRSPINRCSLVFASKSGLNAKLGDPVSVDLGDADSLQRVFTGCVASCQANLHTITVEAYSSAQLLTNMYLNALYEQRSGGAIAKDLLGRAKLKLGTVDDGLTFSSYLCSANQSLWQHLHALAQRCGVDWYSDVQDAVHFKTYAAKTTHQVQYAQQLLQFSASPVQASIDGLEIHGTSPAGQGQSDEASSWLTKKVVKGSAGKSSGNVLRISDATARSQDQARQIAEHRFQAYAATLAGKAQVLGMAELALGDAIQFQQMPDVSHNLSAKILSVSHKLNRYQGFVSEVSWEQR